MEKEDLLLIAGLGIAGYFAWRYLSTTPVGTILSATTIQPPTSGIVSTPAQQVIVPTDTSSSSTKNIVSSPVATVPAGLTPGSPIPGGLFLPSVTITSDISANLGKVIDASFFQQIANQLAYFGKNPATASYQQIVDVYYGKVPA